MPAMYSEDITWGQLGAKVAISSALTPLDNARILMQIGFEPMPPRPTRTLFGRPALGLPNIVSYLSYLKKRDGLAGLYAGWTCGACCQLLTCSTYVEVTRRITFQGEEALRRKGEDELSEEDVRKLFIMSSLRDLGGRLVCTLVSQPLFVVKVRIAAQLVGHETQYSGIFASLRAIYEENGLAGFFSGLIPRVLSDIICAAIVAGATYAINSYVLEDRDLKTHTASAISYLASALTYPYHVVATCSAVSGAKMAAGQPPFMPVYSSWQNCWDDLKSVNQLKRGSSLFFRYYTGPQVRLGDRVVAVDRMPSAGGMYRDHK